MRTMRVPSVISSPMGSCCCTLPLHHADYPKHWCLHQECIASWILFKQKVLHMVLLRRTYVTQYNFIKMNMTQQIVSRIRAKNQHKHIMYAFIVISSCILFIYYDES